MSNTDDALPDIQLDEVLGEPAPAGQTAAPPPAAGIELDIDLGDAATPVAAPASAVAPEPPSILPEPPAGVSLDLDIDLDVAPAAAPVPVKPAAAPAAAKPVPTKSKLSNLDLDALLSDLDLPDTKATASKELKLDAGEPVAKPAPQAPAAAPAPAPEPEPAPAAVDLQPEPEPPPSTTFDLASELGAPGQLLTPEEEVAPTPVAQPPVDEAAAAPATTLCEEPAVAPEIPLFDEPAAAPPLVEPPAAEPVVAPELAETEPASVAPAGPAILETDATFDAAFGDMAVPPVEEPQLEAPPPLPVLEGEPPARSALLPSDMPSTADAIETLKKIAGAGFDPEKTRAALTAAVSGQPYDSRALPEPKVMVLGIARLLVASGFAADDLVAAIMAALEE